MLELSAALYQPRNNIIFKREALLLHVTKNKLFEAVVSEVLTDHEVKELVGNLSFAIQFFDFKALKRLALVHLVDFVLELIKDPRHRSFEGLNIIQFKILAFQDLNLRQVNVNFFFN